MEDNAAATAPTVSSRHGTGSPHRRSVRECEHQRCKVQTEPAVRQGTRALLSCWRWNHAETQTRLANKVRETWQCPVQVEKRTSTDIQGAPGRMDITVRHPEGLLEIDVTVAAVASRDQAELLRRAREPGRAARPQVKRKLQRYGPSVLAFAIEDTGRLSPGASRLLRDLAASQEEISADEMYQKMVRELQHIVLASSANMLQAARCQPRTA